MSERRYDVFFGGERWPNSNNTQGALDDIDARLTALEGKTEDVPPTVTVTGTFSFKCGDCEFKTTSEDPGDAMDEMMQHISAFHGETCETADTPEDVSETPDFPTQEDGQESTRVSSAEELDAHLHSLDAESPPTGDEPHTECRVSAQDVEEMEAKRLVEGVLLAYQEAQYVPGVGISHYAGSRAAILKVADWLEQAECGESNIHGVWWAVKHLRAEVEK